jgi:hypothetical protein
LGMPHAQDQPNTNEFERLVISRPFALQ